MPYQGEFANKSSHSDIVKSPDIQAFLEECSYLKQPSDEEGDAIAAFFVPIPDIQEAILPANVISVDGSTLERSIDDRLPSTKVGYLKVSSILIDMAQFRALRVKEGRYVDPFRVAALRENNSSLVFALPSANIRWKKSNVRDSFRAALDEALYGPKTRFNPHDPNTSLRTTLFHIAARRNGELGSGDPQYLILDKCPACEYPNIKVEDTSDLQACPSCEADIYPTDCLRIWEEVSDFQSNGVALSRLMNVVEHLLPLHYLRYLHENSPESLSTMAFFVDGPLAIFGNSAWLNLAIMSYIHAVNSDLVIRGHSKTLIIGLQKTGQVVDHVRLINKFIPESRLFPITDEYRFEYIVPGREKPKAGGFGYGTYYGQDFIYKTPSGRVFVMALPYPFQVKDTTTFATAKAELSRYAELQRALALIAHFESDLYENAVIPIALAHRYTAISLSPGGRVLDILTRSAMKRKG
jgi:hypothetical protein